jgi:hypothetical protein
MVGGGMRNLAWYSLRLVTGCLCSTLRLCAGCRVPPAELRKRKFSRRGAEDAEKSKCDLEESVTAPGCEGFRDGVRGCRCARPPATGSKPSGFGVGPSAVGRDIVLRSLRFMSLLRSWKELFRRMFFKSFAPDGAESHSFAAIIPLRLFLIWTARRFRQFCGSFR